MSNGRSKTNCSKMGGDGVKKWYGMGERGGRSGCGGFKASDTSGDIFNEIVANAKAFGFGRFGGAGGWSRTDVVRPRGSVSGGRGREKSGKNVVAVLKCGREGGVLKAGGKK